MYVAIHCSPHVGTLSNEWRFAIIVDCLQIGLAKKGLSKEHFNLQSCLFDTPKSTYMYLQRYILVSVVVNKNGAINPILIPDSINWGESYVCALLSVAQLYRAIHIYTYALWSLGQRRPNQNIELNWFGLDSIVNRSAIIAAGWFESGSLNINKL